MTPEQLKNIVEAALLAAGGALGVDQILELFPEDGPQPERTEIREAIEALREDWQQRGVELVQVASGYRFQVRKDYAEWIRRLRAERPTRYSRALLETLALVAYRQPITRAEIEDIRGVSVSSTIVKTLLEREWVRVLGHREVPGRPAMFGTSKKFLDDFNLKSLDQLPPLAEIRDLDNLPDDLFAQAGEAPLVASVADDASESDGDEDPGEGAELPSGASEALASDDAQDAGEASAADADEEGALDDQSHGQHRA